MWGVGGIACVAEEAGASGWPVVDSGDAGGAGVEVEAGRFPLGFVACLLWAPRITIIWWWW